MFNEVSGLVFNQLKAKIEELGPQGFSTAEGVSPFKGRLRI